MLWYLPTQEQDLHLREIYSIRTMMLSTCMSRCMQNISKYLSLEVQPVPSGVEIVFKDFAYARFTPFCIGQWPSNWSLQDLVNSPSFSNIGHLRDY